METRPSTPSLPSYDGRITSQAHRTSYVVSMRTDSSTSTPRVARSCSCQLYSSASLSALAKIVGLVVTPATCFSRRSWSSPPELKRTRERSSSQTATPAAVSSFSLSVMPSTLPQLPVVKPVMSPTRASEACAAATIRSGVNPNCSKSTVCGALAP